MTSTNPFAGTDYAWLVQDHAGHIVAAPDAAAAGIFAYDGSR